MTSDTKLGLLRRLLRGLGLSQQAADDVVNFILDILAGESKDDEAGVTQTPEFPYQLRDKFLTDAERSFFETLRTVVDNRLALCAKVSLSDLFWVKKDDPSRYRTYTNKIDRKHVDFLLCDPATMRPMVGIELDDKSHQRQDRQERDAFVDQVFHAAGLPLLHVPAKRGYVVAELATQLAPFLKVASESVKPAIKPIKIAEPVLVTHATSAEPSCPKCGAPMILRTVKNGANAGNHFWGCSKFPACRS
ncbi:MAG: DUF2726 domain-containing protein [Anaerolineae bacterium]|nr:DUF2726 domain-containing protein [Anaerolineae bacterium]